MNTFVGPNVATSLLTSNAVLFRPAAVLLGPAGVADNVVGWRASFFKVMGKVAWLQSNVGPNANRYKKLIASTMRQMQEAMGNDAITYSDIAIPLFNNLKATIDSTELVTGISRRLARDIAVARLKVVLSIAGNPTAEECFDALVTQMQNDGDAIEEDGQFAEFFDFMGVDIPQSEVPTVPDEWVTYQVM